MKKLSNLMDKYTAYFLILPAIIFIVLFSILPIIGSLRYAFFDMQLNDQTRNDIYTSSQINLAMNQEIIEYVRYFMDIEEGVVKEEATKEKIANVRSKTDELENYIKENLVTTDMKKIVPADSLKLNGLLEKQETVKESLNELYSLNDEFYSKEDANAVIKDFETSIIKSNFIGLNNFSKVLSDKRVISTLIFTLIFTFISVAIELVFGLFLAMIMNKAIRGRSIIRTLSLIPWAIPTSVAALMWGYLYNGSTGVISNIFTAMGLISGPAELLNSGTNALGSIIIADVWKTTPYMALLLLGGLQVIPDSLYESSALDGANKWKQFTKITLPLLKPSIFVALLFRTLDAFRVFDLIYVLTGGGPGGTTESISIYAYKVMFSQTRFGYGSAMVIIMALAVGIITFVYIKALNVKLFGTED